LYYRLNARESKKRRRREMLVYTESYVGMTEYIGGWKQYEPSPMCASWAASLISRELLSKK
jgi:hypothetical protein